MKKKELLSSAVVVIIIILAIAFFILILPSPKTTKFIKAVQSQDIDLVGRLLAEGADPNQTDIPPSHLWSIVETSACRPIYYACVNGDLEMVKLLIDHGATAEYREHTGWSPLRGVLFSYETDDLKIVELLLENGANPDVVESGNNSIFAAADMPPYSLEDQNEKYNPKIAQDITSIVQTLLGDRPVDMRSENGMTLLMVAARRRNLYLVEQLLQWGCDPTLVDYQGKTAADYANIAGAEEILNILN